MCSSVQRLTPSDRRRNAKLCASGRHALPRWVRGRLSARRAATRTCGFHPPTWCSPRVVGRGHRCGCGSGPCWSIAAVVRGSRRGVGRRTSPPCMGGRRCQLGRRDEPGQHARIVTGRPAGDALACRCVWNARLRQVSATQGSAPPTHRPPSHDHRTTAAQPLPASPSSSSRSRTARCILKPGGVNHEAATGCVPMVQVRAAVVRKEKSMVQLRESLRVIPIASGWSRRCAGHGGR